MRKLILYSCVQLLLLAVAAQPYVDLFQLRFTNAFRSDNNKRGTPFTHLWAGSDLPIKIKDKTYLLLSPYYENWQVDSASVQNIVPSLNGLVLPAGFLLPLKNPKWSLALTAMVRSNGEKLFAAKTFQYGGAVFFSHEKAANKKIRFGAYMNADFFGFFFMPLLGADWRMNENNYFFGLLPGRFTWEHRFNPNWYGGITFRAITNSYRLQSGQYVRTDDNQLSAFLDIYPAKKICITLEPGYGILRKLRMGTGRRKYFSNDDWGDGLFIKLSAAWRIRLENGKTK
jgi:hypothetical protein